MILKPFFAVLLAGTISLGAEPVSLLPRAGVSSLQLSAPAGMAERSLVQVEHPSFSQAVRVTVNSLPDHPHQIQLNQRNNVAVSAGDTIRIRGIARSASPGGVPVRSALFVQDSAQGFRSVFDRGLVLGPNWESFSHTFAVRDDFERGRLQISLFLGEQLQTAEVGLLTFEIIDPETATAIIPDLRRTVSVQGEYLPVNSPRARSITGSLPAGWEEDSAWADVRVHYRPQFNNPFNGDRSLRVEVQSVASGGVQFRIPNVVVTPSHFIRMRIPLRSEDNRNVVLQLRQRGAPYRVYWQTNLSARPEWGVVEVLALSQATDMDATLMFALEGAGSVEIGDFEMEYLTPQQSLAARDFTGNLLPSSSFPIGLSAPWAIGANGTTPEHVQADPEVRGPSGLPALRLVPHRYEGRLMMQITSPFIGNPGHVHTFSFWAKADRNGKSISVRMGPPSENLWQGQWNQTVTLSAGWRRYEMSVLLPPAPDMLYLARITSHAEGVFWVDQAMVEVGEQAGPFERPQPVEVHAVAANEFGLFFTDQPLEYRLAVSGDIGKASRLVGTLLDLYGNEVDLPTINLEPGAEPYLVFDNSIDGLQALGSFVVTYTAVDDSGSAVSRPVELILHRVREPRHWGEAAYDSPFGIHVTATPGATAMAKALGFNWNRLHYKFNWNGLSRSDGTWNLAPIDRMVDAHEESNLLILTHFGGTPRAYSSLRDVWETANPWWRNTAPPRMDAMDEFEEYAYQVLSYAGHALKAVETWNEPFLPSFFPGRIEDGRPVRAEPLIIAEMNRRVRAAAERAGHEGALLWNIGPHYGASERAFDTGARDLGSADPVDGFSLHRYTNSSLAFPNDQFIRDMEVIREVFAGKPALDKVWNSEGGHGLSEIFNLYRHTPPYMRPRADQQSTNFVRYFLSNFAAGIEKVFIYTFYPQDGWISSYGYMNVDGRLPQIASAASNMTWQLEGKQFVEFRQLSETVFAQLYEGESENVVVLLPSGRGEAGLRSLPRGMSAYDLYGNPPSLPVKFTPTLLYVRGPGLTLEGVSRHLSQN